MSVDEIRQRLADMRLALEELKDNDFPSYHRHRIACENFKKHAEEDIAYLLSLLEWQPIENHWEDRLERPTIFRRPDGSEEYAPEGVSFFDFNEDEGPFVSFRTLPKGSA